MSDPSVRVSLVAACGACLASVVLFVPSVRDALNPSCNPIAVVWAMLAAKPRLSEISEFTKQSVIGGLLGALSACVLASLGQWRFTATVLSFPFVVIIAACGPDGRTPLQEFVFPGAGLLVHYGVLAFGPKEPRAAYMSALHFVTFYFVGGACTAMAHVVVGALLTRASLASDVRRALFNLLSQMLYTAEGAMAYLSAGDQHREELVHRLQTLQKLLQDYKTLTICWRKEPWSDKPDKSLLDDVDAQLATAVAQLTALVATLEHGYSDECHRQLFGPFALELQALHFSTITALRAVCRSAAHGGDKRAGDKAVEQARSDAKSFWEAWKIGVASGDLELLATVDAMEVARCHFAQLLLRRFALQIACMHLALSAAYSPTISESKPVFRFNVCTNSFQSLRQQLANLCAAHLYFEARSADKFLNDSPTPLAARMHPIMKFPLRLATTSHLVAVALLVAGNTYPEAIKYGFWAVLPCLLCILPTTGAAILKGFRRFAGTLVGSGAALLSLYFNPGNAPALATQLFLITFVAKYASTSASIDYAGLTTGFTWHVVVLAGWMETSSDNRNLDKPLWRILMTTMGVVLAIVGSLVLFPNHAVRELQHDLAEALICTVELGSLITEAELQPVNDANVDSPEVAASRGRQASLEAFLRVGAAERRALLAGAKAERWFVSSPLAPLTELQLYSERLADAAVVCGGSGGFWLMRVEIGALERFLDADQMEGRRLRLAIADCLKALRTAAVEFGLRLGGVRLPRQGAAQDLRQPLAELHRSFAAARVKIIKAGAMPELLELGIDHFYALVYGLSQLVKAWIALELLVSDSGPAALPGAETHVAIWDTSPRVRILSESSPRDRFFSVDTVPSARSLEMRAPFVQVA